MDRAKNFFAMRKTPHKVVRYLLSRDTEDKLIFIRMYANNMYPTWLSERLEDLRKNGASRDEAIDYLLEEVIFRIERES